MFVAERTAEKAAPPRIPSRRPACLIATCESWWSTATLPALVSQRFAVTGLSPGTLGLSRHVEEKLACSRDPAKAALALRDLLSRRSFDWVIVADDNLFRAVLAGERGALREWFPVDPLREDIVALVTSKHALAERARQLGIPVPESRLLSSAAAAAVHAGALGYPVVVKGPYGYSGSEVFVATSETQLRDACRQILRTHRRVLLQRFVAGPSASAAVLYERGTPLAYKAYLTECPYPQRHSAAALHRPFRHASLDGIVRAVGAATGFNGMAGLDFVLEESTGRLFAIEINPRPTSAFAGTNADRAFFGRSLERFGGDGSDVSLERYDGMTPQAYFPDFAFYFFSRDCKKSAASYKLLLSCLAQARGVEPRIAAWSIARNLYDRAGDRLPALRSFIDRRRLERR